MRLFPILFCFSMFACAAQEGSPAHRGNAARTALIISNGNYQFLPKLPASPREASAITEALKKAHFEIVPVHDFAHPAIVDATEPKLVGAVHAGDICVLYYSGYAVQANGETFLLPVNFDPKRRDPLQFRAYSLTRLLQKLDDQKVRAKVVVLEASRDIEPPIEIENMVSSTPAAVTDPDELRQTIFAFAAAPGQIVTPPANGIGLFTAAVANNIAKPGVDVNAAFREVQVEVARQSPQTPYVAGVITFDLTLVAAPPAPPPPKPVVEPVKVVTKYPATDRLDREEYVWIPSGKFLMGCVPKDVKCETNESPQHAVTITHSFWIGRNEVQVKSYRRFVDDQKIKMPSAPLYDRKWQHEDRPIVDVSWEDAAAYCKWVGGRLPTEAEWEYAARGGIDNQVYPLDSENSREKANFAGKKGNDRWDQETAPVRSFDPNPFQLFDMFGNVWEWVQDWSGSYPETAQTDPQGPANGKQHIARGGSFDSDAAKHLRISIRKETNKAANNIGFRCVLPDSPETEKLLTGGR